MEFKPFSFLISYPGAEFSQRSPRLRIKHLSLGTLPVASYCIIFKKKVYMLYRDEPIHYIAAFVVPTAKVSEMHIYI